MNALRNRFWAVCLTALMWMPCTLNAEVVTVANPDGGAIYSILDGMGLNLRAIDSVKVTGTLNETDFKVLGNVMTSLLWIDLTETNITGIPEESFSGCDNLRSIYLPPTLKVFGNRCFNSCNDLTTITGYENVQSIGEMAFYGTQLKYVPFADKIVFIGDNAFGYCSIEGDIVFPECLNSIANYAFNHTKIKSVDFSKCSVDFNWGCFEHCYNLESVFFPEHASFYIEGNAFYNDTLLQNVFIPSGVTRISNNAFGYDSEFLFARTITMQSSTPIDANNNAFGSSFNEYLTLNVPSGSKLDYLISRGYSVFGTINEVGYSVSVEGPGSVKVGGSIYENGSICFPDGNNDTQFVITPAVGYEVASVSFNNTSVSLTGNTYSVNSSEKTGSLKVVFAAKSLTLTVSKGNGGTITYNGSALQNGSVIAVNGGESVSFNIVPEQGNFVKSLKFNGTDVPIIDGALNYDTPLLSENASIAVEFGTQQELADYLRVYVSTKGFGSLLYNGCNLNSGSYLLIRKGVNPAFTFVPANEGYVKSLLVNSFDVVSDITDNTYILNSPAVDVYLNVEFFSPVAVQIDSPAGKLLDKINEQGINSKRVFSLKLTGSVTERDIASIKSLTLLQDLDISQTTIAEIPDFAFQGMNLTRVDFPSTLIRIGQNAFENCINLVTVTGFENIRRIESSAFVFCEKLTVFPFGDKIEAIKEHAFEECNSLPKNVILPASLKEYGGFAFAYYGINTIDMSRCTFENSSITWYPFAGAKNVLLPEQGNYSLGYAFARIKATTITIPSAVTYIWDRILDEVTTIRDIYMQSSVPPTTDSNPFGGNISSLITLHVPSGSADLYKYSSTWSCFGNIVEYGIGVQADGNGVVYANGKRYSNNSAIFSEGGEITVSLLPNPGYDVAQVLLDGNALSAQPDGTYLIPAGSESGILSVRWQIKRFGITVNYQGNGKVLCAGRELTNGEVLMVDSAQVVQFDIVPTGNYLVRDLSFNGVESVVQNGGKVYVTPAITGASALNITFAESSGTDGVYEFNVSTGDNGSIVYRNTTLLQETSINIKAGERAVFEINPKAYYKIAKVTYNNNDVTQYVVDGKYVVNSVIEAASINVIFAINPNVTVALNAEGTLGAALFDELKENVERLTVAGPMSSTDFNVIRDNMPNLKFLDLSNAEFSYVPDQALYSDSVIRYLSSIKLPPTVNYINCEAFKGCSIDTLYLSSLNACNACGSAFDASTKVLSVIYVPIGLEDDYRNVYPWNEFKHVTDGVLNRIGDEFLINNIEYTITDFENKQVQALINTVDEYDLLPETVQVGGYSFAVAGARLANMDANGNIIIVPNGDNGPWRGKYLYSAKRSGSSWEGAPDSGWMNPDFDDSSWTDFDGPISSLGYGGYTEWKGEYDCYWIRRTFELNQIESSHIGVNIRMDDEIVLYINGTKVYEGGSNTIDLPSSYFRIGKNVIAAQGLNSGGAVAYMDISIFQNGFISDGLLYAITNNEKKEIAVSGAGSASDKIITIPANVSFLGTSYKVTSIARCAFQNDTVITAVLGMNNIERIEDNAFDGCLSLVQVEIPEGLSYLGESAFRNCSNLKQDIIIPPTVWEIKDYAFESSGIRSVELNSRSIGYKAFYKCKYLERIVLSEGIRSIRGEAFADCSGISGKVVLPSTLTELGHSVFYRCNGITEVNIPSGIMTIYGSSFNECSSLSKVEFSEGLRTIESNAFSNTKIVSVDLPLSLKEIDSWAFCNNHSLKGVIMKDGILSIGEYAFYNCDALESITFPATLSRISSFVCGACFNLKYISIPQSITSIGECAFEGCAITELDLSGSIKTVERRAFNSCNKLVKIRFNEGLQSIGESAFCGTSVDSIILPSTVRALNAGVFGECRNLVYIKLPDNLNSIGANAFSNCGGVQELTIPRAVTSMGENSLRGIALVRMESSVPPVLTSAEQFDDFTAIILPEGAYDAYCNATYWSNFKRQFSTVSNTEVVAYVEQDSLNSNLAQVLGEEKLSQIIGLKVVGTINSYDIMVIRNKMNLLRYLDLSDATIVENSYEYYEGSHSEVYVIGDNSFRGINISRIDLPLNTTKIGNNAFNGCKYLTKIVVPDCVETIGYGAFANCDVLQAAYIGDAVTTIESSAFSFCGNLREVKLGKNVEVIGSDAFWYCRKLRNIEFNKKLKYISNNAFFVCEGLTDVVLPPSLIEISNSAFYDCRNLKELKIPSSVKYIRDNAFYGCQLEKVYTYTIEPTKISQNTFSAYKNAQLFIPATSKYNYYWDTQWSQFLELVEFDEPYEYFYLNGDYSLDNSTGRISGVPDMEMNQTAGITVEGNDVQEISDIELNFDYSNNDGNGSNDAGPSIIAGSGKTDNGVANLTAQSMDVNIGIDGNRWYFFCFPYDLDVDSIECSAEYVFYKYDGLKRSRGLSGWTKLDAEDKVLVKGNGYIFQASNTSMLTIHVAHEYLSFTGEIENLTLNTYDSDDISNSSWNFVGNPFISYYDIKDLASEYDAPIAVWNGWTYDVYKPGDDDYQLKPFEAFFVQKGSNKSSIEYMPNYRLTYSASQARMASYAEQRAVMGTPMSIERQLVNIVIMNQDSVKDRTRIVYSAKASMDYEIGVDAAKFQSEGVPQIYTLNGTTKYAINERPMGDDDIRLGFCAPTAGTYTLSIPRQDADVAIFDKETGKYVDFTFGDYTFESKAGTFNDRFVIHRTGGVTAIENGFMLNGLTVVAVDGGIDIEGHMAGKVSVYSESGMLIAEPTQTGRLLLGDGVYIVKIGDKSIKLSVN